MQDFRLNVRYKNTVTQPRVSDVFSFSIQIKEEAEEIFFGIIIITDFEKKLRVTNHWRVFGFCFSVPVIKRAMLMTEFEGQFFSRFCSLENVKVWLYKASAIAPNSSVSNWQHFNQQPIMKVNCPHYSQTQEFWRENSNLFGPILASKFNDFSFNNTRW